MPAEPDEFPAHPKPEPVEPESIRILHIVRRGETVWAIARAYGQTVEEIAQINGLADVNQIHAGQRLLIPGAIEMRSVPSNDRQPPALMWPVPGREILSPFGAQRRSHRHTGLDIRGKRGEPVTAAAAGKVVYSGKMHGYGKTVILDHGGGLETLYAHNDDLLVKVGDVVFPIQKIATVGRTGNATTEHCHFEVRRNGVPLDPLRYLGH
jgi:murein DD-endopeptidase MepM/ murein hydrolase activator NlpD